MHFLRCIRAGFTFWLALILVNAGFARERGPRVDVVCPSPPLQVRIDKQQVLVYELHVTNFDTVPLTLTQVDVFANDENITPLISLADDRLAQATIQVGSSMTPVGADSTDRKMIAPGKRAVIFLWIAIPSDHPAPMSLRHRILFSASAADGGKPTEATLVDLPVPVSQDAVPTLSPPFNGGIWVAGDGPANDSPHRRSILAIDGHIYSPERFAIDWVKIGPNGDTRHDGNTRNENWWGYGEPVLAVADGEITEVVDGIPDNTPRVLPPVTLDNIAGNHVILQIAPNHYVTYAHLQNGSIKVRLHDRVHHGEVIALLGNSGNSTGAHLHLQVTDRNSVLQSEGVPFVFGSFTYLGPGSDYPEKQISVPWTNSIPPGNGVIEFMPPKK